MLTGRVASFYLSCKQSCPIFFLIIDFGLYTFFHKNLDKYFLISVFIAQFFRVKIFHKLHVAPSEGKSGKNRNFYSIYFFASMCFVLKSVKASRLWSRTLHKYFCDIKILKYILENKYLLVMKLNKQCRKTLFKDKSALNHIT